MSRAKGFKLTEEHKRKIGLANSVSLKGKKQSLKQRRNESLSRKRYYELHPEVKKKISKQQKGRKPSMETRRKISISQKGEKANNWKGGISTINDRIRHSLEYRLWRTAVFERDNYTCIWCGLVGGWNKELKIRIILNADHIKPFALFHELRFAIDNGRTLCESCHMQTNTWGVNVTETEYISIRLSEKEVK